VELELLKIKAFLLNQLNKGTFAVHVQDMLEMINNALDTERKPS
jgi:hypothetical protein